MKEIERKFLVTGDFRENMLQSERFVQGYICAQPEKTVRVRMAGRKGFLTIKGASDEKGLSRFEFEREISPGEAEELFKLCEPGMIEKVRHQVKEGNHVWEVDIFHGANEGLVLAEIELQSEDESFELPAWIGKEVTGDRRYYNSMLAKHPFSLRKE
ncbi:MAG: CYTH domain-containing protein [Tannerellaceae bacterium]|jgi:CYTH domain-containing protein|nr:CYTH domain-containing protein [Tannerellaceae bacterium]